MLDPTFIGVCLGIPFLVMSTFLIAVTYKLTRWVARLWKQSTENKILIVLIVVFVIGPTAIFTAILLIAGLILVGLLLGFALPWSFGRWPF